MKRASILIAGCGAVLVSIAAAGNPAPETDDQLHGVSVRALWQAANSINPHFLTHEPTFVKQGAEFVGTAVMQGLTAANDQPIELEITWTVSEAGSNSSFPNASFSLPEDARYVLSAHFNSAPSHAEADTYTAVSFRDRKFVVQYLGYRTPEGRMVAWDGGADGVFEALGIHGPFKNQIALQE